MTAAVISSLPGCLRFDVSMALLSAFFALSTLAFATTLDEDCASEGTRADASDAVATLLMMSTLLSSGWVGGAPKCSSALSDRCPTPSVVDWTGSDPAPILDSSAASADKSCFRCDDVVLDGLVGVSSGRAMSSSSLVCLRDGVGLAGVPGRKGSAGSIWEAVLRRLALLEGREVGRDDDPSRSGRALGLVNPGGTVGVERRFSLASWPPKPGGIGGVEVRDSSNSDMRDAML